MTTSGKWLLMVCIGLLIGVGSVVSVLAQGADSTEEPDSTEEVEATAEPIVTVAPGDATGVTVTVDEAINVRSGPGTEYTIRGVAKDGTLDITGRNDFDPARPCRTFQGDLDMWVRVDLFGIEGWMARCIAQIDGDLSIVPVVEPADPRLIADLNPSTGDVDELGDPPVGLPYVVGNTLERRINLRAEPSLEADVISVVSVSGIYVVGSNADGSWAQVYSNGQFGWMARFLLSLPRDWQDIVGEGIEIPEGTATVAPPVEATPEVTAEATEATS